MCWIIYETVRDNELYKDGKQTVWLVGFHSPVMDPMNILPSPGTEPITQHMLGNSYPPGFIPHFQIYQVCYTAEEAEELVAKLNGGG